MSQLQFDLATLTTIAIFVVSAFWTLSKLLLRQVKEHLNTKFIGVENQLAAHKLQQAEEYALISKRLDGQDEINRRLERELMESRIERERDFVRRDDFNRVISTFQVSVDHLRLYIERLSTGIRGDKP